MTDPVFRIEACRSCQAAVIWAATAAGKTMPVDAVPSDQGNVELTLLPGGGATATVLSTRDTALAIGGLFPDERQLRTSHFTTCPHADQWRKK